VEAVQIQFIEQRFGLSSQELAKALGVAPVTVTRWEQGLNTPTGLQAEVLQGLYNVALSIRQNKDQQRAEVMKGLVVLGIGALIFYFLSQAGKNQ
jgi:transcriptional regulator with XRE-family HTH domain